ncbi:MAG: hypothetical protein ACYTEQ_18830 [Planctomycetota bacterium]|jgi:hypothetical protein
MSLRTLLTVFTLIVLGLLAGCNGAAKVEVEEKPLPEGKELLTVDFNEGRTLRYKFISSRTITLVWGSTEGRPKSAKETADTSSESLTMVVAYTPMEVNPYGLTTVKATCESVEVKRTGRRGTGGGKDPVRSLVGKTFTFTVRSTGEIEDYSQIDRLMKETAQKAFRPYTREGRIKDPDMIGDVFATQWFLWDSISSIENPIEGVAVGQTWKSQLFIPAPMLMWKARDVDYTLSEINETEKGRTAVIRSSYAPSETTPTDWPVPYTGTFQVSGRFGLLRGYKIKNLQGRGEELFNINAGRIERYSQRYKMVVSAFLLFPLPGANPEITINQRITMQLLPN